MSNGQGAGIVVIGAGLAGSEAAWQAAQRGMRVLLYEMRPERTTPAHQTGDFAELVCSNSLGSNAPDRAMGVAEDGIAPVGLSQYSPAPTQSRCRQATPSRWTARRFRPW